MGEDVVVWLCELVAVPHTLSDCDVVRLCEPVAVAHTLGKTDGEEEVLGELECEASSAAAHSRSRVRVRPHPPAGLLTGASFQ